MRYVWPSMPYLIHPMDVQPLYNGLVHYTKCLEQFKSWMDKERPENKNPIENITEEIHGLRKLTLHMYESCFVPVYVGKQWEYKREFPECQIDRQSKEPGDVEYIWNTIKFFRSVVESGEPWTETCQQHYDKCKELLTFPEHIPQEIHG